MVWSHFLGFRLGLVLTPVLVYQALLRRMCKVYHYQSTQSDRDADREEDPDGARPAKTW